MSRLATVTVETEADGLETFLAEVEERISEPEPFLREAGRAFEAHVREHFEKELGEDGAFAPLSADYAAAKTAAGFGGLPILQRKRDLLNSVSWDLVGDDMVEIGPRADSAPHGIFHALGTSKMPRRNPVFAEESFVDSVVDAAGRFAVGEEFDIR